MFYCIKFLIKIVGPATGPAGRDALWTHTHWHTPVRHTHTHVSISTRLSIHRFPLGGRFREKRNAGSRAGHDRCFISFITSVDLIDFNDFFTSIDSSWCVLQLLFCVLDDSTKRLVANEPNRQRHLLLAEWNLAASLIGSFVKIGRRVVELMILHNEQACDNAR